MWDEIDKTPLLRIKINFFSIIHDTRLETTAEKKKGKARHDAALTPPNGRHPVESDATSRLTSETSDKHCRGGNVGNRIVLGRRWMIAGQKRHTHSHCPDLKIDRDPYQGLAGGKIGGVCPLWGKYPVAVFFISCVILFPLFFTIIMTEYYCHCSYVSRQQTELAVLQRAANVLRDEKIDLHPSHFPFALVTILRMPVRFVF